MPAGRPIPSPLRAEPGEGSADAADLAAALDAAACLGPWAHELPADRVRFAPRLGKALGLPPEAWAGVPLARFLSGLHGEDRPRVEAMLAAVHETGARFEMESRVPDDRPGGRGARVLRLMGRAEVDPAGRRVRTRGLAFDLTELRLGRASPPLRAQWQVNQFAGHVIAMKELVAELDSPALARLLDRMAIETGVELARRLGQAQDGAQH